ncbi:hypothetical protein ACVU7I_12595, partial [Patulibacter sp. S7RM1-6]
MRQVRSALLAAAALALLSAGSASAAEGEGLTAPAYPGNVLRVEAPKRLVAGVTTNVRLTGTAAWSEAPTGVGSGTYGFSLYVQDADAHGQCAATYGDQLAKVSNGLPVNATTGVSGFVMSESPLGPTPPAATRDYALDTPPFAVRPGVRRVLLCAYQRFITDDVAVYGVAVRVAQPRCRFGAASARRGRRVLVRCSGSGPL